MWGEPKFTPGMFVKVVDPHDAKNLKWDNSVGRVMSMQLTPQGWRYRVEIGEITPNPSFKGVTFARVYEPCFSEAELQGIAVWMDKDIVDGETDE